MASRFRLRYHARYDGGSLTSRERFDDDARKAMDEVANQGPKYRAQRLVEREAVLRTPERRRLMKWNQMRSIPQ
jgi:hypothetical protein